MHYEKNRDNTHLFYHKSFSKQNYQDGVEYCKNLNWNEIEEFQDRVVEKGLSASASTQGTAKILNELDNTIVHDLVKPKCDCDGDGCGFLAGSDRETEGQWKWEDGSSIEYSNWAPGEPNNVNNAEHYIFMWKMEKWNEQWIDYYNTNCYMIC